VPTPRIRSCRESSGLACERGSARRRYRPEPSRQVRRTGGYSRDESPDRPRGREDVDSGATGMRGDRLQEQRTAPPAIGKQPPPEVSALPRPADGPPRATAGEKSRNTIVSAACRRTSRTSYGPEVPVHDPRLMCGELPLYGCPLVARRRGPARPPEQLVQFDYGEAGDFTQAGSWPSTTISPISTAST
jgi:hypothetical protein